jgi:PadR family transcriptional regulator PadR
MVWRALFRGFVQTHILYHASHERVYGTWLMEELGRHGYALSAGTLYPILHALEARGLLVSTGETVDGKRRKYYRTTPAGLRALHEARQRAVELVAEIAPDALRS